MRKLKLRFDPATEEKYRRETTFNDLNYIRYTFLLFILLYGLFSVTDYLLVPEHFEMFAIIRFGIVIPIFMFSILHSFNLNYYKYKQAILLVSYVAGGIGIVVMLLVEPQNIVYYGGLMLVLTSGYFMIQLSTVFAGFGGTLIMFAYLIGAIITKVNPIEMIAIFLFILAENILGTIGAYQLERLRRNEFINSHLKDQEISTAQTSTILALAKLAESRDLDTGEHIERVGQLTYRLADSLPLDYFNSSLPKNVFCNTMQLASALHDIGKVGIPDAILNKPGQLTKEEMTIMKTHVEIGYSTLSKLHEQYPNNAFVSLGIDLTLYHHEWFDGTGYPTGLVGTKIPLAARIMAIVDTYDALTNQRPYKPAYSHEQAMAIINQETGSHFDPQLVHYFNQLFNYHTN
jgi:hypothetical protein